MEKRGLYKISDTPKFVNKHNLFLWLIIVLYGAGLFFFYYKYVPLVTPFQAVFLPILFAVLISSAISVKLGTLSFIFFFPLISNLPYFFGIFEHVPHAPTALVLFLFYFFGCVMHRAFQTSTDISTISIFKPIRFFSVLLFISLIITSFRYANFFPFLSDSFYELVCNVNGVTAGGAIMSALFNFLSYISGFLFFTILLSINNSTLFAKRVLVTLFISAFFSLSFGIYQILKDTALGNTPFRVLKNTINATFKDPISLGAFLAVMIPLILGAFLALKKWKKLVPFILFIAAIFVLPRTGSLSSLLASFLSLLVFVLIFVQIVIFSNKLASKNMKKRIIAVGLSMAIIGIASSIFYISKNSVSFKKLRARISQTEKEKNWDILAGERFSYFWPMAAQMIKDYPSCGAGIGSYIIELPNYAQLHNHKQRQTDSAENYVLQVGSELGVLALLCILWIFWEIFKQIRITFRENLRNPGWNFLIAGICAGVISIFMIIFVHSFIGSFEIIYVFWLLVGLLFSLDPTFEERKKRAQHRKGPRTLSFIIIVIFSSSLLWNSTHSLSLKSRTSLLGLKQNFGLYQLEKEPDGREFRWTREYGGLLLKVGGPIMKIPILASHPDIRQKPVKVKLYFIKDFFKDKRLLSELTLEWNAWETYRYDVSLNVGQEVILLIKVGRTWNPLKTIGTPDPRNLGVAVGRIEFENRSCQ